jgi:pimeloyl-ACP methyl ester carboxylesterase
MHRSIVKRLTFALPLSIALLSLPVQGAGLGLPGPIPGTPFERHIIEDDAGRRITYYLSRPKAAVAPLLLMLQGSGCVPVLEEHKGTTSSTYFNVIPFAQEGRFSVMVVEKPFAVEKPAQGQPCSARFNTDFTAKSWLKALQASLRDARKSSWVHARRTVVFGHSEGAVMATMLAGSDASITDVIAIGGSGTTQLYDFIVHAYRTCFNAPACLADVENKARAIARNPDSANDFAWGHPFKRWNSFFRVDPSEELLRSKARVYIAFGTADKAVPALSQEIMLAKLLAAGRDVTVRRVPDAEHSLRQPEAMDVADLDREYRAALAWFWQHNSPGNSND